ncbi:MAG: type II toxin-antitoxin system HicA family toxin [Phycisphaeraceae bacterium]|nr:type II toxin-antitoxin system HicA family toxin [Phycisphaeraceae bacterium]
MGRLPLLSSRDVMMVLVRIGFVHDRTRGSHHVLVRADPPTTLVVPERREVPRGTLRSILREAGVSEVEFLKLLDR